MALFKTREEYLETRILDYDPALDEQSGSTKRRRGVRDKENKQPSLANSFQITFEEKVSLKLLQRLYKVIDFDK
jgi:hypothetical protein